MVAPATVKQPPTPAEYFKGICAYLKGDSTKRLSTIVSNHIAAKHQIHSLPAFHTSDDITDAQRAETYREIVLAMNGKDYSKLLGQVAAGQAANEPVANPLPTRGSILPPARVTEPPPPVVDAPVESDAIALSKLPTIEAAAVWCRKPSTAEAVFSMVFAGDKGDGFFAHPTKSKPSRIIDTKNLTASEFDAFCSDFFVTTEWLDGIGGSDDTHYHAVVVTAPGRPRLLVNPEGFSYARYVGMLVQDREEWAKHLGLADKPVAAPSGAPEPSAVIPLPTQNSAQLHALLAEILAVTSKYPGATINLQISLPTRV